MQKPIYLDYMASTPLDPRVAAKICELFQDQESFGNAGSQHYYGQQASALIADAAEQVAALINTEPRNIIWTSGATEAINLALKGATGFYQRQGKHIITCKTEHAAALTTCNYLESQGFAVTYLTPEPNGLIDLAKLIALFRPDTILVSLMHVNNEIGVIQDIAAIGEITRARGILFHVDAAQSVGKLPIDMEQMKIDLLSFTAHKFYGPKGIGALCLRKQPRIHLAPLIHGGGQQQGVRSGTLPTCLIVGLSAAMSLAYAELDREHQRVLRLHEKLWNGIKQLPGVFVNGSLTKRLAANLNVTFTGIAADLLIAALKDLAISTASACTKSMLQPSHVLQAIGLSPEQALSSVRISLGRFTTEAEIDLAIAQINYVVKNLS